MNGFLKNSTEVVAEGFSNCNSIEQYNIVQFYGLTGFKNEKTEISK